MMGHCKSADKIHSSELSRSHRQSADSNQKVPLSLYVTKNACNLYEIILI